MIRVATFASQQLSLSQQMKTQSQWAEANIQASSGKESRDYAGIAVDSSRLISLENMSESLDSYIANIDLTDARLQNMESSVAAVFDIATEVRTLLMEALNAGNAEDAAVQENASILLEEVAARLNVSHDGRYLFAGAGIDTPPVDLTTFDPDDAAYDPNDPSLANAGYYAGDDTVLSVRIEETVILDYGVTATESGMEALLRGLYLASTAAPTDTARLESALDLMNTAIDELPDIRARIGTTRSALEHTKLAHSEVQLFASKEISDIENVDVVRTMTRISALQLQLEASYMITAQMANITLINFLR
jgi:flagellar hook-associated protein 3 FlgL